MFGTCRKYAQALLERMDSQHVTRPDNNVFSVADLYFAALGILVRTQ